MVNSEFDPRIWGDYSLTIHDQLNIGIIKKYFLSSSFHFRYRPKKIIPHSLINYVKAAVSINQFSGSVLIAKHDGIIYQKHLAHSIIPPQNQSTKNSSSNFTDKAASLLIHFKNLCDKMGKLGKGLKYWER